MTNNDSLTHKPFVEHPAEFHALHGGEQWEFRFPNGYGASVVQHQYSQGGRSGAWEIAVLDADGSLTYSTPVTSDVIGWQSVEEVREVLRQIAELPAVSL